MTIEELAVLLNVKRQHIYALVRKGLIPYHKFGALLRFYASEVQAATRKN